MRHSVIVISWLILLGLVGCAEDKGIPERPPDSEVKPRASSPEAVKPDKEDPAARAIVEKAIAAHTGGKPERLEKFKTHHIVMKGRMVSPEDRSFVNMGIETWSAWPDQFAIRFDKGDQTALSWAVTPNGGYQRQDARTVVPMSPADTRVIHHDCAVLAWGGTIAALANPGAMYHHPGTSTLDDRSFRTVRCYVPGQPEWTLWFDEKTGLLDRIFYQGLEGSILKAKSLVLGNYAEEHGVKLPKQISLTIGGTPYFQMKVESLETPEKLEPKTFTEPPMIK